MKKIIAFILAFTFFSCLSFSLNNNVSDYIVIDVPYISQLYPHKAVVGCEPTALLMALKSKGVANEISLKDFLEYMPKTTTDPAKGFAGSPYVPSETIRTTIYPKALTDYANTYMPNLTRDISGSELDDIKLELLNGNPVVIYATMWWNKPFYKEFNIEGQKQWLLRNNHAVLLTGYDAKNQKFYVADPYNKTSPKKSYYYWIDESKLKPIYDERKWAIAVGEAPKPPYPESVADLRQEDYVSITINKHYYQGITYDGDIYLDPALVIQKESSYKYIYDPTQRSILIYTQGNEYAINLINKTIYKDNSMVAKLSDKFLLLDGYYYLTKQDIDIILNLIQTFSDK